jgi:hypothetical protein
VLLEELSASSGKMTVLLYDSKLNQAGPRLGSNLSRTNCRSAGLLISGGCSPYEYTLFDKV